ncbi:helix-turn-helix transcriptional regulator [Cellvibrio sp. OA-2007]|uniref:helix-turn-helix transcriptional regulator n=1 Tax=Cellvibrio sp. OA-2007 TaxID=529823 RepID=UPI00187CE166|nr:helix-turn-helix transcriptional regulator [Cellvibrio sp. OA-2007]
MLLALIGIAAITNVLEDLRISGELHLISPIFVLGYGPALYFAVRRLIGGTAGYQAVWHFLPMLLVIPFTAHTQLIIAVGTVWRIAYALLTLKLIIDFNQQLTKQRSDAAEVSLAWLAWLIGVSTLFSALDLLRLNFQIELGAQLNTIGYAASSFIFLIVCLLLILILNNRRASLETVTGTTTTESSGINTEAKKGEESAADYQSLFAILDKEILAQQWYCQQRLTLNQLSDLSGMATRDISRSINLVAGMSFNDYINQHRIEKVKNALSAHNNINLTDLAFAAGFSSKATFNQSFKKATGMTPSEFRDTTLAQNVQKQDSSRLVSRD